MSTWFAKMQISLVLRVVHVHMIYQLKALILLYLLCYIYYSVYICVLTQLITRG